VNLNPSLTGDFNGGWRATLNYNELKTLSIPFKNYMISYDQPIYIKAKKIGVGVSALHDETGNNIFNKEKVYVSGSYIYQYRNNFIKIGIQPGYVQSNIKLGNEIWPDQYNQLLGSFEPEISSGENIDNTISYFDLNFGVSWKIVIPRHIPQIGFSIYHINSPKVSNTPENSKQKPVFAIHGTNDWIINNKLYLSPVFIYKTNFGENYLMYGSSLSYKLSHVLLEKSVFAGIDMKNSYKNMSAISFYGGVKYNQWQIGVSYDYSLLKTNLSVHGPLEIYIRYIALGSRIQSFSVPCSRF
jgi:type IX secretion system PorP/SprF family membrane protein